MNERPKVRVSGDPSHECPYCFKNAYREVFFPDGRTGWFCYACEFKAMDPAK